MPLHHGIGSLDDASFGRASGDSHGLGKSAAIVSVGTGLTALNEFALVAAGAPGSDPQYNIGTVELREASDADGELDSTGLFQVLYPPGPTPGYEFGWSLRAADVRACHAGATPGTWDSCGQELLVGEPDVSTHSSRGRFHWYEPYAQGTPALRLVATVPAPTVIAATAEFGYSLASPRPPATASTPWEVAGWSPGWVAVGAPGAELVVVYSVNPSSAAPFTLAQTLASPAPAGKRFGHAVVAADFDGDGTADLAVGAPSPAGAEPEGSVYVYRGQASGSPLAGTPLLISAVVESVLGGPRGQEQWFGKALAAGRIFGLNARDGLVVGAPMHDADVYDVDAGAVCQYRLISGGGPSGLAVDTSTSACRENPWNDARDTTSEEYGAALAVGNFVSLDSVGNTDTEPARHQELAVGMPGWNAEQGQVVTYLSGGEGVRWLEAASILQEDSAPAPARFGAALGAGYVQETFHEDLAIGSPSEIVLGPGSGVVTLTKSIDTRPGEIVGTWDVTDARGVPRTVRLHEDAGGDTILTFVEEFALDFREGEGGGDLCTWSILGASDDVRVTFPEGFQLDLDPWVEGDPSQTTEDLDAMVILDVLLDSLLTDDLLEDAEISREAADLFIGAFKTALDFATDDDETYDVTVGFDGTSSPSGLSLDIDLTDVSWEVVETLTGIDATCRPGNGPWGGEQLTEGICE